MLAVVAPPGGRGQGELEGSPQSSPEAAFLLSPTTTVLGVGLL